MSEVVAYRGQVPFDLAIQQIGSVEGVFEVLDQNPFLELDLEIPSGMVVSVPPGVIDKDVAAYFTRFGLHPVSGLGEVIELTWDDMSCIRQRLDYNLEGGSREFAGVRLWNLRQRLTIQVNYGDLSGQQVNLRVDQSVDGIHFSPIPGAEVSLDASVHCHTFNILGLLTNYVRGCVIVEGASSGILYEILFLT